MPGVTLLFYLFRISEIPRVILTLLGKRKEQERTSKSDSDGLASLLSISISSCNITLICSSGLMGLLPGRVKKVPTSFFLGKEIKMLQANPVLKRSHSSALGSGQRGCGVRPTSSNQVGVLVQWKPLSFV